MKDDRDFIVRIEVEENEEAAFEEAFNNRYEAVKACCRSFAWLLAALFFMAMAEPGLAMWYAWTALIGTSGWFLYTIYRWVQVYFF